ncbi:MAG: DMT family transporter, partial [Candidatus Thorarchaeota archaeon]
VVITALRKRDGYRLSKRNLRMYLMLALTGIFGYGVFFLFGMQFTTSAQGSIIAGLNPVTVSLFAHVMHNERLARRWQYIGFPVSFTGVIFVVGVQTILDFQLDYLIGNLIIVCAMILWGVYSSIGKEAMKTMSSFEATSGGVLIGCLLFGLTATTDSFWTLPVMLEPLFWLNALYLGAGVTFLSFAFYFIGIKNIGATNASVFINLVPVFGVLFSVLVLAEPIYWTFIVGLILVLVGITIINMPTGSDDPSQLDETMIPLPSPEEK